MTTARLREFLFYLIILILEILHVFSIYVVSLFGLLVYYRFHTIAIPEKI